MQSEHGSVAATETEKAYLRLALRIGRVRRQPEPLPPPLLHDGSVRIRQS